MAALAAFIDVLRESCLQTGLAPAQVPFIRPANFVAVLNPESIHLVVDDVPIGGIPDHTYLDRRTETQVLPLDAIVGAAIREFGFRSPIGVSLPLAVLAGEIANRRMLLKPLAVQVCAQMRERAVVQGLNLPAGYKHFARFMPAFVRDHPHVDKNVFVMMRFRGGPQYDQIYHAIISGMVRYGLTVLRADDKDYTGDLWENVCLYMLGSRFGVAVFEEIDLREFSPNVAFELGFMTALGKRCLLLKDQRMPRMPTDIVGKLYKEFDSYNIGATIQGGIESWARDLGREAI